MEKNIVIKALKYPDIPHYEWQGELIKQTTDYLIVLCKPGTQFIHHTKGKTYIKKNAWLEFFSLREWHTISTEIEKGEIISYYCNVALPSVIRNSQVSFIDLDLDLVKEINEDWKVVDTDEFEFNSSKYGYSMEIKEGAIKELVILKRKIRRREFPFNDNTLNLLDLSAHEEVMRLKKIVVQQ